MTPWTWIFASNWSVQKYSTGVQGLIGAATALLACAVAAFLPSRRTP